MCNESKTATNNAWTSTNMSSLNSCEHCDRGKSKKTQTDNDWTLTTTNG